MQLQFKYDFITIYQSNGTIYSDCSILINEILLEIIDNKFSYNEISSLLYYNNSGLYNVSYFIYYPKEQFIKNPEIKIDLMF